MRKILVLFLNRQFGYLPVKSGIRISYIESPEPFLICADNDVLLSVQMRMVSAQSIEYEPIEFGLQSNPNIDKISDDMFRPAGVYELQRIIDAEM